MKLLAATPPRQFFLLCLLSALSAPSTVNSADWANWRGPEQTGVSREKNLPDSFDPATGANVIWKAPFGGRSTPIVMHGRVFIINRAGKGETEQERVLCFDANTGKKLWEHRFNVFLTDIVSERVGWTHPVGDPETGYVYVQGVQGLLYCFDKDGKIIWSHSLTEEFGRVSGYGGRVTSPTVDGDLVLLGMVNANWGWQARGGNRFVAFDKRTGKVVWWSSTGARPKDTYYSDPVVGVINGERLLISGGADGGVHAFKVRTGEKVWSYFFGTAAVNPSPVVQGNYVYIAHGEENPEPGNTVLGRVVCLDGSQVTDGKPKLVWKKDGLKDKFSSPLIAGDRLYVCDENARLYCLDAKTGKEIWKHKYGRNARGSPVLADGKIYIGEVNSEFHILKPGPKKCTELHAQAFASNTKEAVEVEINGSPAVADGKVYFMTTEELYCIGLKDRKPEEVKFPAGPKEAGPGEKATHLQVFPADMTLHPSESVTLTARLYDQHGRFLRETKAEWSLGAMLPPEAVPGFPPSKEKPPAPPKLAGEITSNGKFTAAKAPAGQFGNVVAKAEGLTGRARVRVAPVLPYKEDFKKVAVGGIPGGWVNTQGKFVVVEKGGSKVLAKTALIPSPLVARGYGYITMPGVADYTIEADISGTKVGGDLPEMGLINKRYLLVMDGNKQRLRLASWMAVPRIDQTVSWDMKPDVWYRFKLTVEQKGDKAVARGKVWERGKPEPKEWSLEVEDPAPNRHGSPGLYAFAYGILPGQKGTEVYYDNVVVTPNKGPVEKKPSDGEKPTTEKKEPPQSDTGKNPSAEAPREGGEAPPVVVYPTYYYYPCYYYSTPCCYSYPVVMDCGCRCYYGGRGRFRCR